MKLFKKRNKTFSKKFFNTKKALIFVGLFALIGVGFIFNSLAATSLTIDSSLPVPQNVRAFPDDKNIIVTWDHMERPVNTRVVGYYVTYREKGTSEWKVAQQQVNRDTKYNIDYQTAVQLQPLKNGTQYEIRVQSVSGSAQSYRNGTYSYHPNDSSTFYRGDGRVSNVSNTITSTPSSARVDDMRNRLTGFFDDFERPAGPFDELKWNNATTACITPGTAAAFLNDQFHTHNQIRSLCDRAGMASRPRATFDISNATESNPAIIQFDIDGASQPRDTWYLDFVPLSARPQTNLPIDITSHNDLFDADTEDPGNMVRINARLDDVDFSYYQPNRSPGGLSDASQSGLPAASMRSPLPVPDLPPVALPNVRNHWLIEVTPTRMRVIINGQVVATKALPSAFTSQKKFTLHSTIFSYNTGKQYHQVTPFVQLFHWDNFGFTGPAPTEVIHNYLEGGPSGDTPVFSTTYDTNKSIPEKSRTTVIPVPDNIGNLKNGKARLYFTMQDLSNLSYDPYNWSSSQNIVVNGKSYAFPDPRLNMNNPKPYPPSNFDGIVGGYVPMSTAIEINQADLIKGDNTVRFNLGNSSVLNVHLELPYDTSNPNIPNYTQPLEVFGSKYSEIVRPPLTVCDKYWFIERDLGLPYEAGKTNLDVTKGCAMLNGHSNTTPNPGEEHDPTPTNASPTGTLNTSVSSATAPASYTVIANGSDSDGSVSKIEIRENGVSVRTCNNATSCSFNASNKQTATYSYSAVITDDDGATTTTSTRTVTVSALTPPPTSNRFQTLPVNASLPSDAECSSRVRSVAEIRPANTVPNSTRGVGGNYVNQRVTGNYTGTTDEIIQWAACKWGMDEDILRAQMVQESYWHQSAIGDFTNQGQSYCSPIYPVGSYPPQYNGDNNHTNECPESYGLSQVRWTYHKSGFYSSTNESQANLTNNAIYSTAYNVDYWGSVWRACYNGDYTWLNTVEKGRDYTAGDEWGCLGMWYSGRWYTDKANGYITNVRNNLDNRVWETTAFRNAQPTNTIPGNSTPPSDTTPPTVAITAPNNNSSVAGTITVTANASDDSGVSRVSFYLDGSNTAFSNDSTAPYSAQWNSANVSNGQHTIRAVATDTAGNIATSSNITINVNNVIPDTQAPAVSIASPTNNSTVNGTVVVQVNATDNVGVSKVDLVVNGSASATDTTSPYRFSVDTTKLSEGTHQLSARAYDAAGNNTYASIITVIVDNLPEPPQLCVDQNANNYNQPLPCTYDPEPEQPTDPTPTPGDVNGDDVIDRNDLRIARYYYRLIVAIFTNGDMNGDGRVDREDLRIIRYYYRRI